MKKTRGLQLLALCLLLLALPINVAMGDGATGGEVLIGWGDATGYQYVTFGSYEQDSGEPDPILWRVLSVEKGKALLLSEYILDARPMGDETKLERQAREKDAEDAALAAGREPPEKEPDVYGPWEQSAMREWLNRGFLKKAFTKAEIAAMPKGGKLGQVFLPSREELKDPAFGFDPDENANDPARLAEGTRLAEDHNLDYRHESDPYYTRTKDSKTTYLQIRSGGAIGSARYDRDNVGVRPAVYVTVDAVEVVSGSGTLDDPYVLSPI